MGLLSQSRLFLAGIYTNVCKALAVVILFSAALALQASVLHFRGNLPADANVIACGPLCTLDGTSSDSDYAQWAAVVGTLYGRRALHPDRRLRRWRTV
jgi:hypothetical protein